MSDAPTGEAEPSLTKPAAAPARQPAPPAASLDLAHTLEPDLVEACDGRITDIHWFTSDWQQGGSSTAQAVWHGKDGPVDAIVKLPVGPTELAWSERLGKLTPAPVPGTLASGHSLHGYDLGWIVIEKLRGDSVSSDPSPDRVRALLEAVAHFQEAAANELPPAHAPKPPDWPEMIEQSREATKHASLADAQRWNEALKKVQKILPELRRRWLVRPINAWCHGDVHPGNGLINGDGTCRLIDLGNVHAGHWVEDAVMLERLFWGRLDRLDGLKPVSALAKARRERGLDNGPSHNTIANVRRVLMAACVPGRLARDGHPCYVSHALDILERITPKLS